MYEVKKYFNSLLCVVLVSAVFFTAGIGCTKPRADVRIITDQSIVDSAASAARLEALNAVARGTIEFAAAEIERIRESLRNAVNGIDGAIVALDSYDRFVQQLIQRIRELEQASRAVPAEDKGKE